MLKVLIVIIVIMISDGTNQMGPRTGKSTNNYDEEAAPLSGLKRG